MANDDGPSPSSSRQLPNIVVTGTPGTGKTSHASSFVEACDFQFKHLNVGEIVKDRGCHEGWNEEWQSYDVDEDKVRGILREDEADLKEESWRTDSFLVVLK